MTRSAEKTAADQKANPDTVDFGSTQEISRDYSYSVGVDRDLTERARLVTELCGQIAQKEGVTLFEESGAFPLPANILEILLAYVDRVMENDDRNARSMSLLVAEALHEHPRGLEFLYLRSKTFTRHGQGKIVPGADA